MIRATTTTKTKGAMMRDELLNMAVERL